jgi:hypothetical protein
MERSSKIAKRLPITLSAAVATLLALGGLGYAQDKPLPRPVMEEMNYESPNDVLRSARLLCVRSRSKLFDAEAFEREILKRGEKEKLELFVTRDESQADLIIEIYRKRFTTRFVFSVIEPKTKLIVASDRSSSLGGDIEPDLANLLIKKFKAARQ